MISKAGWRHTYSALSIKGWMKTYLFCFAQAEYCIFSWLTMICLIIAAPLGVDFTQLPALKKVYWVFRVVKSPQFVSVLFYLSCTEKARIVTMFQFCKMTRWPEYCEEVWSLHRKRAFCKLRVSFTAHFWVNQRKGFAWCIFFIAHNLLGKYLTILVYFLYCSHLVQVLDYIYILHGN